MKHLLTSPLSFLCCFRLDETFWTALTAIATIALIIVGGYQLKTINKTSKEDFLHKLKTDFFTKEARYLIALIQNDLLKFKYENLSDDSEIKIAYFEVIEVKNKVLKEFLVGLNNSTDNKRIFISYEMDDFLLQHLEDLGFLYKKKMIDFTDVDQLFSYYVEAVYDNCEIRNYIDWIRINDNDNDIYKNFTDLYHTIKLHH